MSVGLLEVVRAVLVALFLGGLIGLTYARAYRGLLLSASFVHTVVISVPLVSLAVLAIRAISSTDSPNAGQALAFAFVGLLGLIRFRTVIRDTREFTFIFLAIVIGAGVGSGQEAASALACCLLLLVLVALEFFGFGKPLAPSLRARVSCKQGGLTLYEEALGSVAAKVELIAIEASSDEVVYSFEVVAKRGETLSSIMSVLNSVDGTVTAVVSILQRINSK